MCRILEILRKTRRDRIRYEIFYRSWNPEFVNSDHRNDYKGLDIQRERIELDTEKGIRIKCKGKRLM
jgi:hypothetical protein